MTGDVQRPSLADGRRTAWASPMALFPKPRGERIRCIRRVRRLSQEALAALAGVSAKTVSRAETGCTKGLSDPTIAAIGTALGVAPVNFYDPAEVAEFLSGRIPDFDG